MVFRATRKLMLWYLEQQENSCFAFRATRKSMLKVIRATRKYMPQFQGPIFLETWNSSQISLPNLKKNKNATLINALIGSIFWNKNISCHDTFNGVFNLRKKSKRGGFGSAQHVGALFKGFLITFSFQRRWIKNSLM